MFKKPLAHQSNATPLRSSARRQLLISIFAQYPTLLGSDTASNPTSTAGTDSSTANDSNSAAGPSAAGATSIAEGTVNADADVGTEAPAPVSEKELGKIILPEGVRIASFENSVGVEGTFWLSPDGDPLWMTFGRNSKEFVPTLSLLAQHLPHPPLPIIQLYHPLPPPILTGAPLFIPAVRNLTRPHLLPDVAEGDLVAFVSSPTNGHDDLSYIGVGRVAAQGGMRGALRRRVDNLNDGGEREEGKFCDILCIINDHLWDLGSKPALPTFSLPSPMKPLSPPPQTDSRAQAAQAGPSRSSTSSPPPIQSLSVDGSSSSAPASSSAPLSPSEISTLLSISLVQALTILQASSFPIPASLLYSAHVLPNRPSYIPKDKREEVVIGRSEWKKLTKWMKEVGKEGLLKVKETKGEVVVQSFDPKHPSVQNHVDFTTVAQEEAKAAKRAAREATTQDGEKAANGAQSSAGPGAGAGANTAKGKEMLIEELWKPAGAAISFWDACGVDKTSLHQPAYLKSALEGYLTSHNLIDTRSHRDILLDDELGRAVGVKKPEPGQTMARDLVLGKLKAGVSWSVSVGGTIKKGPLQPITMTVKTRQGRKTVTHVSGLETFSVDVDSFAEEMKKVCAGSASVQPLPGASPKLNLQEVLVQGSQVKQVTQALLNRGIPRRWIRQGDDSKKKK